MIDPGFFHNLLAAQGTDFFTGVPDSLLKSFCAWLADKAAEENHIIAVNEGAALALASGYHLATGKIPLVYMQNSGLGNAVNPLLSLADGDVCGIPLILLVGWRGEPGVKDEPQHLKQGKVTRALFEAMGIPHWILSDREDEVRGQLAECYAHVKKNNAPAALVARTDAFGPYVGAANADTAGFAISREEAIEEIILSSSPDDVFVATTGMASRELYELREKHGHGHDRDFLMVGAMGHASSLALALALQKPDFSVNCLDGDGAALMHLGALAAIGARKPANLRHIVLNNGAHDSVGGQPTVARQIDLLGIARSVGYARACLVRTLEELRLVSAEFSTSDKNGIKGPFFMEVQVRKGGRKDLGRPKSGPAENKDALMRLMAKGKS